ncbi:SUR7-domain-containing protein [Teratosphaeria nubilosa]|uniref:SUR7-domain-containing protein n=1 Tax=Teratosphaeria nubilosa TaxID=161662 RepID=A0A6G1LLK3_9PEZI|nr:SUR7-domain-containing protein [Teratosphaeria nubilosa]
MAVARPLLALTSIILLAGGIVLTFFIVLSGAHIYHTPLNLTYFLQSTTNGITSASTNYHNPARWTYFSVCGVAGNRNANCGRIHAAQAFNPQGNFGVAVAGFGDTKYWYYMSRFAWVFMIIGLFFAVIAFLMSAVALCTRLGSYLTGSMVWIALFFDSLAAALYTAWIVEGRNHFRANGQTARIGPYAMGFIWATWAAYFLAAVLLCTGGAVGKSSTKSAGKKSYFGRKQSTRSRGSFIDNESQRRVKDEYD